MNYFRAVTRELKRLDALSRSPIYSHFSETLVRSNVCVCTGMDVYLPPYIYEPSVVVCCVVSYRCWLLTGLLPLL